MRHLFVIAALVALPTMASSQTQTWNRLTGQKISAVCPADGASGSVAFGGAAYSYSTLCKYAVWAWGSAVSVTKAGSERLVVFGGGHSDYGGNEAYAVTLATRALTRISNPSQITSANYGTCAPTNDDGTMRSSHIFGSAVYLPVQDKIFIFSGGVYCGNGFSYSTTWWLDPYTGVYTAKDPINCGAGCINGTLGAPQDFYTGSPTSGPDSYAAFDPVRGTVFIFLAHGYMEEYTPSTNQYIYRGNNSVTLPCSATSGCGNAVIDSTAHTYWLIGGGYAYKWDISSSSNPLPFVDETGNMDASCNALTNAQGPGLYYDSSAGRIIGYVENGGATLYSLNPATKVCATVTPEGSAPGAGSNLQGVYGRLGWFPGYRSGTAALVNDWDQDTYLLQSTTAATKFLISQ